MAINGVNAMANSLASLATGMQGGRVQQQLGMTVLKQALDNQEMLAQALIQMVSSGPTLTMDGTGQIVNIGA
jgi:hypothetical protein